VLTRNRLLVLIVRSPSSPGLLLLPRRQKLRLTLTWKKFGVLAVVLLCLAILGVILCIADSCGARALVGGCVFVGFYVRQCFPQSFNAWPSTCSSTLS